MSFDTEKESKCFECGRVLKPEERHRLDPEDEADYCGDCIEIAASGGTARKAPPGPRVHEVESITIPFHQLRFEFFDKKGMPLSDLDRATMRDIGRNILVHGPGIDPHRVRSVALPNLDYSSGEDLMAEITLWPQAVVDGSREAMKTGEALSDALNPLSNIKGKPPKLDVDELIRVQPMKMLRCEKHDTSYAAKEEGVTIGECAWCMKEERDALKAEKDG